MVTNNNNNNEESDERSILSKRSEKGPPADRPTGRATNGNTSRGSYPCGGYNPYDNIPTDMGR